MELCSSPDSQLFSLNRPRRIYWVTFAVHKVIWLCLLKSQWSIKSEWSYTFRNPINFSWLILKAILDKVISSFSKTIPKDYKMKEQQPGDWLISG